MQGWHLVSRWWWSVRAGTPDPDDEAWLLGLLTPAETVLYEAQPPVDRHHAVRSATRARALLGDRATTPLIVASALHDVGKAPAGLGTTGRVLATLAAPVVGDRWRGRSGWRGRVHAYRTHAERGAADLTAAGSAPEVVAWAREHHWPVGSGSVAPEIAAALRLADDG